MLPKQRGLIFPPTLQKFVQHLRCSVLLTRHLVLPWGEQCEKESAKMLWHLHPTYSFPPQPQFALQFTWMHTHLQEFFPHPLCCPALCPSCFSRWRWHELRPTQLTGTHVTHPATPSLWGQFTVDATLIKITSLPLAAAF